MVARELVADIRRELGPIRDRVTDHPYLRAVEERRIELGLLRPFVGEQFQIVSVGLRNLAHLAGRFGGDLYLDLLAGERAVLGTIPALAAAIGMSEQDLLEYEPMAEAHAYAAYTASLAAYASEAEVAAALAVNFPGSAESFRRLGRALRLAYELSGAQAAFFGLFEDQGPGFEAAAIPIIDAGLGRGVPERLLRRSSRLLAEYEALFWDALYERLEPASSPLPLPSEAADLGE